MAVKHDRFLASQRVVYEANGLYIICTGWRARHVDRMYYVSDKPSFTYADRPLASERTWKAVSARFDQISRQRAAVVA